MMERKMRTLSQPAVLWLQVCGLAGVQGAITLTWVIYNLYLPQLLGQFGFPKQLAVGLLILENALAVVMEPLMGGLSDQTKRWMGSRFPFISVGVVLSSALFIAIPSVVIFGKQAAVSRWVLPVVLVAWALAMTVFRSPAISLLGRYAAPAQLPLAASLLTLAGGVIGAFKPIANRFVLSWGAAFTFAIGSFVLLGAAAVLRWFNSRVVTPDPAVNTNALQPLSIPALGLILGTGAGVAWGTRFLMETLPKVLKSQLGVANVDWLMVGIAIALAFAALPAGAWAVQVGNRRAMLIGIGVTVVLLQLMVFMPSWLTLGVAVVGLIAAFSLVVNGAIPFALALVPPHRAGLGTGMYFGGAAGAASLLGMVFPQVKAITPVAGAIGGAIAFLVAAVCIALSLRVQPT
jgi:MFS family permease